MLSQRANILQLLLAISALLLTSLLAVGDARADWSAGITGSRPNLGNVASGVSGDTVFQVAASTGSISKVSGAGDRVSSGSSLVTVTVACGNVGFCNNDPLDVTVTATGSPTGRARTLTSFTAAPGTGTLTNINGSGTSTLTFTLGAIGKNSSKTFHVGMNFPIAGNDSGLPTGAAQSSFLVTVQPPGNSPPINLAGTGVVTVYRALQMSKTSDLNFGRVVRPISGSGTVAVNALTGLRTLSGAVGGLPIPSPTRASYSLIGEGGRTLSISVPATFDMTGPNGVLTVTTTTSVFGTPTLSAILGLEGTYTFHVGGSFPVTDSTPSGLYTGVFNVSVSYN